MIENIFERLKFFCYIIKFKGELIILELRSFLLDNVRFFLFVFFCVLVFDGGDIGEVGVEGRFVKVLVRYVFLFL